jgi:hypothetical protein
MNNEPEARLYGGWRQARGLGPAGVTTAAAATLAGVVLAVLATATLSLRYALYLLPPAVLVVGVTVGRVGGDTIATIGRRRVRWLWATRHGWTSYRATVAVERCGGWVLPGPLATSVLVDGEDRAGRSFGVVWDRRTGHLTATVRVSALSTWLVEDEVTAGWVQAWHEWLANLGFEPSIVAVAVTGETGVDRAVGIAGHATSRITADAPGYARTLMYGLIDDAPASTARTTTRVSVTFNPRLWPDTKKELEGQIAEVDRLMVGLETPLRACGVSNITRLSRPEIAGVLRIAFDPAATGIVDKTLTTVPGSVGRFEECGPIAHNEGWDRYLHDGGTSVSWGWLTAPRQRVPSHVLARLLGPSRTAKRVTLLYRPYRAEVAAAALESQVNAASFRTALRRTQGRDETARDRADHQQAVQAAAEEAAGAGLVNVSVYVTATVTNPDLLPVAVAEVEARAGQSKIKLRRLYGGQYAGFLVGLPVGFHPTLQTGRNHK